MSKKLLSILLIFLLILSFAGCGETSNGSATSGGVQTSTNDNSSTNANEQTLVDDDIVKVTFKETFEVDGVEGVFYLRMNCENKTDKEIWVALDSASVNGEMVTVMSGGPMYITPGNSSNNPFIISYANISASTLAEIQEISFKVVVRDKETLETIETTEIVTITMN